MCCLFIQKNNSYSGWVSSVVCVLKPVGIYVVVDDDVDGMREREKSNHKKKF